jgi:hypothetical protein
MASLLGGHQAVSLIGTQTLSELTLEWPNVSAHHRISAPVATASATMESQCRGMKARSGTPTAKYTKIPGHVQTVDSCFSLLSGVVVDSLSGFLVDNAISDGIKRRRAAKNPSPAAGPERRAGQ